MRAFVPVLSCREAVQFERELLTTDEAVWRAMERAGEALGKALLGDFYWWKPWPGAPHVLLLVGKGNNAGDALIAAAELAEWLPELRVTVVPVYGVEAFKPLAQRAFTLLEERLGARLEVAEPSEVLFREAVRQPFTLTIDGILGAQFSPPVRAPGDAVLEWCASYHEGLGFRVAVDLPSGLGDEKAKEAFSADLTYATGVMKAPALAPGAAERTGRLRFLDLGFFEEEAGNSAHSGPMLATRGALNAVGQLRPATTDKRYQGYVYLVGGSRNFPGAILMTSQSAARAGAGMITAFVPFFLSTRLAVGAPEVMWRPLPAKVDGEFEADGVRMITQTVDARGVLLIGPGMLVDRANTSFVTRLLRECALPMVLDAGALSADIINATLSRPKGAGPVVVTPHFGEYQRLNSHASKAPTPEELKSFAARQQVTLVLKGTVTQICDGERFAYAPAGNPVLARGGSGDLLGGMVAARLAVRPEDPFLAATEAVLWHGEAADMLARERGEVAVKTTELLDYLAPALRSV